MHVRSVLTRKGSTVATIHPSEPLSVAVKVLRREGVGALVVSGDGATILGILSERDVVRRLAAIGAAALEEAVSGAMTTDVVTCGHDDTVEGLMQIMTDRRVRHLPVVESGALAGIISIGDIVKVRLGELENENRALADYVANTP